MTTNDVADVTVTVAAASRPKVTVASGVKLDPLTVTLVPPLSGPLLGLIEFTVGAP